MVTAAVEQQTLDWAQSFVKKEDRLYEVAGRNVIITPVKKLLGQVRLIIVDDGAILWTSRFVGVRSALEFAEGFFDLYDEGLEVFGYAVMN